MRIGIAGAGGIGSNVAMLLIRAGFKNFTIADYDNLEESNLNRQFYFKDQLGEPKVFNLEKNLSRLSEKLDIKIINKKLDEDNIKSVFAHCPIVVEAFDKKEYKSMLIEQLLDEKNLIVSASGIGGTDLSNITEKNILDKLFIYGDFETDIKNYKTYSTKVMIVAAMMANKIIKYMEDIKSE